MTVADPQRSGNVMMQDGITDHLVAAEERGPGVEAVLAHFGG